MQRIVTALLLVLVLAAGATAQSAAERLDYKKMIAQESGPPTPAVSARIAFTGSGLNDLRVGTVYSQTVIATYTITISAVTSPNKFNWTKTGGSGSASASNVSITGSAQTLSDSFTITFLATTGHTNADAWVITVFPATSTYWDGVAGVMKTKWSDGNTVTMSGSGGVSSVDLASPGPIGGTTRSTASFSDVLIRESATPDGIPFSVSTFANDDLFYVDGFGIAYANTFSALGNQDTVEYSANGFNGKTYNFLEFYKRTGGSSLVTKVDKDGILTAVGLIGPVTGNVTGNVSGTAASFTGNLTGDITSVGMTTTIPSSTITNAMLAGSIADTKLSTISTALKVSNSATTAASANTASAIVARDGSGNFTAGTITAALSGNASTATSATSATSATNATNGATVTVSNSASYFPLFAASSSNGNQPFNLGTGLSFNPSTNTLTTTTFSGALTGNSSTATILATSRNIAGQPFNGSASITIASSDLSNTANILLTSTSAGSFPTLNQDTTGYASALKSATTTVSVSAATAPTTGQVLTATGASTATWQSIASGSIALSAITAATATNTIDNTQYAQVLNWSTLAGATGLALGSTSTAAASNAQKLFSSSLSGINGTALQTTYAGYFSNTHTGTTSTNVGLYSTATGGVTANYAGLFIGAAATGVVGVNTTAPSTALDVFAVENSTLTNFTQKVLNHAIAISFVNGSAYAPGMVWYTSDSNPTKPTMGLWGQISPSGSYLYLGTSNSFATGITKTVTIDYRGFLGLGNNTAPLATVDVAATQSTTLTDITQSVVNNALVISTGGAAVAGYNPGLVWVNTSNTAKPRAGIWTEETSIGSYLFLGTSNNYATGITNQGLQVGTIGDILLNATPAASLPALMVTGVPYAAGSTTTNFPLVYINSSNATASTTLSASGTALGINAHTGVGDLANFMSDGVSMFKVTLGGTVTANASITAGNNIIATNVIRFASKSILQGTNNGIITLTDSAQTAMAGLQTANPLVAKTANYQILFSDSNTVFTNTGASGEVDFTLPVGTVGTGSTSMVFYFYVAAAQTLKVIATGSETIQDLATTGSGGGNTNSNTVGNYCALTQSATGKWVITSQRGVWSTTVNSGVTTTNAINSSSQTTAPTIATTGTSATVTTGSTDEAGTIEIVATGANTATVTFNLTHGAAPKSVVLFPTNAAAIAVVPYVSSMTSTTFVITFTSAATLDYTYQARF